MGCARRGVSGVDIGAPDAVDTPQLHAIAAAARYWWERDDHECTDVPCDAGGDATGATSWERWRDVAAEGDWEAFTRRLRWAGIDPEAARRLVEAAPVAAAPLPRWAVTAQKIVERTSGDARGSSSALPPREEGDPVPFEDLLAPAVRVARAELQARCRDHALRTRRDPLSLLSDAARGELERGLLRRLAALAAQPFYREFSAARPYGMMLLGMLDERAMEVAGTENYLRFVERLSEDGLLGFFRRYPVVARLLAVAVDQWVDTSVELVQRLDADLDEIERCIFGASPLDAAAERGRFVVVDIQTSLSDPHRGGHAVAVLTLADGRKLVYKPKNVSLEVALNAFLEWCNEGGCREKLRVVRVLDRGDYGWVEHVEHAPCADLPGAQRFYRRAGMLLCVLHVLRATDCHHGNLIASGEHPVLVDAETLLHPDARPIDEDGSSAEPDPITREFLGSVLRTLLLPAWHVTGDGEVAYDISGLGGGGGDPLPQSVPDWRWTNTDAMVLQHRMVMVPVEKNVVRVRDNPVDAADFEPEIVAGFEEMYRGLVQRREALVRDGSPLTAMRDLPVRFLFRATRIYVSVLMNACAPEYVGNGARFSIELDHLSRAFLVCRRRPVVWPILDAELSALGQLDVPYFTGYVDGEALEMGDGRRLPRYFRRAAYLDVLERISRLGDDDLHWQVALIHGSFQARVARNDRNVGVVHAPMTPRVPAPAEMRVEAERLALELDRRAIWRGRGETNWLGLNLVAATERVQLQLVGDTLYEGRCGVALFLAALHRITAAPRLRELVQAALASVQRLSRRVGREPRGGGGIPDLPGPAALGSTIYALVKIAEFLGDPEPLDHARTLAASMTADVVASDSTFDVLSGSAGAILGLLSLHRAQADAGSIAAARAFGDHLLEQRISYRGGPRAWRTIGARPLTGFSHGAAGIAYALLRLYEACGEDRFRAAAFEGMAYERTVFSPAEGNWPDLREADEGDDGVFPDQWCHGAAGIALARVASGSIVPDASIDAEVAVALRTTQRVGLKAVDHLCCGNAGRIEALWVGAHRMGRADWHDAALAYAGQMRERASRAGTYQLFPNLPCDVFNPGFFRGVSGIGYQWLRLAEPELPSVLLWE